MQRNVQRAVLYTAVIFMFVWPLFPTAPARAAVGAALPYDEIEAENAVTTVTIIGPDRTFTTLAAEASGRKAVTLSGARQYVEFTLPKPANSIVVP
jgi:hypothetical protein